MKEIVKKFIDNRHKYQDMLIDVISLFMYREQRYNEHFSMILIYIQDDSYHYKFTNIIRESDKYIQLDKYLHCIFLDSSSNDTYIKGAESILYKLQKEHLNNFYFSTVNSENYNFDKFRMINKSLDILQCALKFNAYNIVIDNDYMKELELLSEI